MGNRSSFRPLGTQPQNTLEQMLIHDSEHGKVVKRYKNEIEFEKRFVHTKSYTDVPINTQKYGWVVYVNSPCVYTTSGYVIHERFKKPMTRESEQKTLFYKLGANYSYYIVQDYIYKESSFNLDKRLAVLCKIDMDVSRSASNG